MAYILKQATWKRKGKIEDRFVVYEAGTANAAIFKSPKSARKAISDLLGGKAEFCACGVWLHYKGGNSSHICPATGTREGSR